MADRPPFDATRAAFYLVATILLSYIVIAIAYMGFCWAHADVVLAGKWQCDANNRIFDLLAQALSAALAFAGGYAARGKEK